MSEQFIFCGNKTLPASQVRISPFDRGFLYGDGVFDTIKAENGVCEFLEDHLERFRKTCEIMRLPCPDIDFEQVISGLLEKNRLTSSTARVKLIITRGVQPGLSLECANPPLFLITAVKQSAVKKPSVIGVYPVPRTDPVAEYKTLSYIYNLQAKQWASENGVDDAVLLDTEGRILECTSSNIFIQREHEILKPRNRGYYLEGIMGKHFCVDRQEKGYSITETDITLNDIRDTDRIIMTNSMIGVCEVKIQGSGFRVQGSGN